MWSIILSIILYGLFLFGWKTAFHDTWTSFPLIYAGVVYYVMGFVLTAVGAPLYAFFRKKKQPGCLTPFVWPAIWFYTLWDLIRHPPFVHLLFRKGNFSWNGNKMQGES